MPTVIATPGASDANSYVTVAEATAYFGDAFGKARWATSSQADQEALVITASRSLDQLMSWTGRPTSDTQNMWFPATGTVDRSGRAYPSDVIPTPIKYATMELAYYMLENSGLSFVDQTIDRVKVASVEVEFTPRSTDVGIPDFIERMVGSLGTPIVYGGSSVQMSRLVRT